jgi:hypothetical protein
MPNVIKATNLTVTKAFGKFFIAQDVFKKTDGSEGKLNYKVWSTTPVSEGQVVDVVGNASANVNEFTDQSGKHVVYAQLSINAKEVTLVAAAPAASFGNPPSSAWDTF